jgi:virginiamycin B lyase
MASLFSSVLSPPAPKLGRVLRGLLLALLLVFVGAAVRAQTITEFALPSGTLPIDIAAGPDGAVWFTDFDLPQAINRISPSGTLTQFTVPAYYGYGITTGPDGALWAGFSGKEVIGRLATDGTFTEYATSSGPAYITSGPDGALWFTEPGGGGSVVQPDRIGRISTAGVVEEFTLPRANSYPSGITAGPDGALWFAEIGCKTCNPAVPGMIGRITPAGTITEFPVRTGVNPYDITRGPDDALWFTHNAVSGVQSTIGRMTTDGTVTDFPIAIPADGRIILGPDGAFWIAETDGNVPSAPAHIARLTTAGVETDYATPNPDGYGGGITAGPDGNIWFAETYRDTIGKITLPATNFLVNVVGKGRVTSSPAGIDCRGICTANFPQGQVVTLTEVPDSGWAYGGYTYNGGNPACGATSCSVVVGAANSTTVKFVPIPPAAGPIVASVSPSSRSVRTGVTATAFALIVNAGNATATGCSIAPSGPNPGGFSYQTTDRATNIANGTPNTPVDIPGNGLQTFTIGFTSSTAFNPAEVALRFSCTNTNDAPVTSGVNTLQLGISTVATSDVIALGATFTSDGILHIKGTTGSNAFAVATVNVGVGEAITAEADLSVATLPLGLTICQTNSQTGACLSPPASTAATQIPANGTPTFSIFATASAAIPFAPASNRIIVKFKNQYGELRGETSVAVDTE